MKVTHTRIIVGLLVLVAGAGTSALMLGGCGHNLDDCRNTLTCPVPQCTDAGLGSGECCTTEDGGMVCTPLLECAEAGTLGSGDCCMAEDGGLVCSPL